VFQLYGRHGELIVIIEFFALNVLEKVQSVMDLFFFDAEFFEETDLRTYVGFICWASTEHAGDIIGGTECITPPVGYGSHAFRFFF
jgi:hypothetical protein